MSVVPAGMVLVTTPAEHREAPFAARARIDERTSERTDARSGERLGERLGERFDALLDELVEFEVREARIAARRAAVVDELRLLSILIEQSYSLPAESISEFKAAAAVAAAERCGVEGFRQRSRIPRLARSFSVGRDRYSVPADLETALRMREETCRFRAAGAPRRTPT